jgi:3-oxoacyl-[acyl-carrier protein] reductase
VSDEARVALVTGAGTGIGAACARSLAEEGFRVAVHYRQSVDPARELSEKLPDAFTIRADLAEPE